MIRNDLISLIKQTIRAKKYGAYTGFEYRIPSEKMIFPACWIAPLQLTKLDGRYDGKRTYKVVLYLMQINKKANEETKEAIWEEMEEHIVEIVNTLIKEKPIFYIENLVATPAEFSLTPHGEISLKVEFDVQVAFCHANP